MGRRVPNELIYGPSGVQMRGSFTRADGTRPENKNAVQASVTKARQVPRCLDCGKKLSERNCKRCPKHASIAIRLARLTPEMFYNYYHVKGWSYEKIGEYFGWSKTTARRMGEEAGIKSRHCVPSPWMAKRWSKKWFACLLGGDCSPEHEARGLCSRHYRMWHNENYKKRRGKKPLPVKQWMIGVRVKRKIAERREAVPLYIEQDGFGRSRFGPDQELVIGAGGKEEWRENRREDG